MKHAIQHVHFVGIGGAGMSGIAEILLAQGYSVSGSDQTDSAVLSRLRNLGATVRTGHNATNVGTAGVVVASSAVRADNPEVVEARRLRIPVVQRAEMLAELMRTRSGIAIAGTHGKTTTTGLVTSVLTAAGLDPGFVIGGLLNSAGANAQLGTGDYIVVEADESDASFLKLLPVLAVVTNIDTDHMETYGQDFDRLKSAFVDFLHRMPFHGRAILCTDDAPVRDILPRVGLPVTTYGLDESAQVQAVNIRAVTGQMHFTARRRGSGMVGDIDVVLNLPGRHNVLNALAAIAVAGHLGIADAAVQEALAMFQGVGRRFQRYGAVGSRSGGRFELIEDYGHHPVEIAATLAAARGAYPASRVVLAFQPHRYSRTRDCFGDFVRVLGQADSVLLSEVYPAGEPAIEGADGRSLHAALDMASQGRSRFIDDIVDMAHAILDTARDGDVVLCMGAGSIGAVPRQVLELCGEGVGA